MEAHACNYHKARELFRQGDVAGSTPHLPLLEAWVLFEEQIGGDFNIAASLRERYDLRFVEVGVHLS